MLAFNGMSLPFACCIPGRRMMCLQIGGSLRPACSLHYLSMACSRSEHQGGCMYTGWYSWWHEQPSCCRSKDRRVCASQPQKSCCWRHRRQYEQETGREQCTCNKLVRGHQGRRPAGMHRSHSLQFSLEPFVWAVHCVSHASMLLKEHIM